MNVRLAAHVLGSTFSNVLKDIIMILKEHHSFVKIWIGFLTASMYDIKWRALKKEKRFWNHIEMTMMCDLIGKHLME